MERYTPGTLTAPKGKPANIFLAVADAMAKVGIVAKDKAIGTGKNAYKGVSDYDAMIKIQPVFAELGLVFFKSKSEEFTEVQEYQGKEWVNNQQVIATKTRIFTRLECEFTLAYGHTGEMLIVTGNGHGTDPNDKAVGKALTYAKKTALLALLLTPTGDDTDNEHSNDAPGSPSNKNTKTPPKKKQAPAVTSNTPEKLPMWQANPKAWAKLDTDLANIADKGKPKATLSGFVKVYNTRFRFSADVLDLWRQRHATLKVLQLDGDKLKILLDMTDG